MKGLKKLDGEPTRTREVQSNQAGKATKVLGIEGSHTVGIFSLDVPRYSRITHKTSEGERKSL